MEVILDPKKLFAGIRKTCDDLRQAFDNLEDYEEGLLKLAGMEDLDRKEDEDAEQSAVDALLDAMPEVTPEHRAELREAFQLMEDERDLALARAEAAEKQAEDAEERMEAMEKNMASSTASCV